mmetsp:Transcript_10798/g.30357  ORF Transcript_10798/g.30357 Transcript_10798/m.30357 type:complete len:291 (-) Transcript_10798:815-1687(-)
MHIPLSVPGGVGHIPKYLGGERRRCDGSAGWISGDCWRRRWTRRGSRSTPGSLRCCSTGTGTGTAAGREDAALDEGAPSLALAVVLGGGEGGNRRRKAGWHTAHVGVAYVVDGHRRSSNDDGVVLKVVVAAVVGVIVMIPRHIDGHIQDGTQHARPVDIGIGEVANLGRGARGGGNVARAGRSEAPGIVVLGIIQRDTGINAGTLREERSVDVTGRGGDGRRGGGSGPHGSRTASDSQQGWFAANEHAGQGSCIEILGQILGELGRDGASNGQLFLSRSRLLLLLVFGFL